MEVLVREFFTQVGQTVRFAIADESRTARLKSLITTTAIVVTVGYYVLFVR
ncbi:MULTISPECIES: hypothetical protein [unclassified Streptomyces]|uniref:hypothetical protein n=1 Tax=unclassified Streptomyces TaxID=2593676 RepID=UPI001FD48934|nr:MULTISPECIES: hypothetical protein [unclassified Streptomyces]MDH3035988.1 hypothetical protein [Streptomyces sp. TRM75561]